MNEAQQSVGYVAYPTTRWTSVIQAIRSNDEEKAEAALRVFCEQYRDVVFRFFCRRFPLDVADSYTQDFFLKKIHAKWDAREGLLFQIERSPSGKFRYFLVSALRWFESDIGKSKQDPLKHATSELPNLTAEMTPDDVAQECDREIAFGLLRRIVKRLQVSEVYLKYFCGQISADQAAGTLAISSGAFRVAVHRLVPAIREAFRDEVQAIVADERDVDEEIRYLVKIIAESRNAEA